MQLALYRSTSAGVMTARASTRFLKPGANRSTCTSIRSVMSTVEEIGASRRQIGHRSNPPAGQNTAAQALQLADQRVGDFLRASTRHRPAVGVRGDAKHQAIAAG